MGRVSWYAMAAMGMLGGALALPAAIPTLSLPASFATQAALEHDVSQPQPDLTVYNASGDGHCIERPTLMVDFMDDIHLKDGVPFTFAIGSDNPDTLKAGQSFRVHVCGSADYATTSLSENPQINLRTGGIGTLCTISVPSQPSGVNGKKYLWVVVEAVPRNGAVQRIIRRLMIECADFYTIPGNQVWLSGGDSNASDSYSTSSQAAPFSTFYKAQTAVNDGGIIMADARYPVLWDKERTGSNSRSIYDAVEVRPYNGTQWSLTRTGRSPIVGFATDPSNFWKSAATIEFNKIHFYNAIYDTYRINFLTTSADQKGVNIAWMSCQFTHEQMARDGHFLCDGWSNDGPVFTDIQKNIYASYNVSMIGCSGLLPATGALTLGVNNNLEIPWDIVFAPPGYEFAPSFNRHQVIQNRNFLGSRSNLSVSKLPITSITRDTFNEIAVVQLGAEVYPGKASISISGTSATVTFFKADGVTPYPLMLYPGTQLMFDSGPLSGSNWTSWTYSGGGGKIVITGVPAGTTSDPAALVTLKFRSWAATTSTPTGEFNQFRILDGAARSAYNPEDSGGYQYANGINRPEQPRKLTPDYPVNNYIMKSSLGWIALSSQYGAALTAAPPMNYTPLATVAGNLLTAAGSKASPTAGPGNLSVTQVAGLGYLATIQGGGTFTAAQIYEAVTIRAGGRTIRAAAYVNATGAADANNIAAYSFFLRDWDPSWPLLSGASWTFSTVEGHGLVPGFQVRFGSGTVCTVISTSGRAATLDVAPGDVTTPTAYSRYIGTVDQVSVLVPSFDIYGQPTSTLLDGAAAGDGVYVTNPGSVQHNDGYQFQVQSFALGRSENAHIQNSRLLGNQLQSMQVGMLGANFTVGRINVPANGNYVTIDLPTLAAGTPTVVSGGRSMFGVSYPAFTFTVDYSRTAGSTRKAMTASGTLNYLPTSTSPVYYLNDDGSWTDWNGNSVAAQTGLVPTADTPAGCGLFSFFNPKREVRVLFKTGVYVGKSFRLHAQTFAGAVATMTLIDDKALTSSGVWAGSASDTFQQPLPIIDGDVIFVGGYGIETTTDTAKRALAQKERMFVNDWSNIGSGWIDEPITGVYAGLQGSFGSGAYSVNAGGSKNWTLPYQMRDLGFVASQVQFGLAGYDNLTIANVPGGGVGSAGARNFYWKQSSWFVGKNSNLHEGFTPKSCGMYAFTIIDSLHGGITQPNIWNGTIRASQVKVANSLLVKVDTAGQASDYSAPASVLNTNLSVDPDTGIATASVGSLPIVRPTHLFDCFGRPLPANTNLLAGAAQAA